MKEFAKYKAVEGINHARALLYSAESLPLPLLNRLLVGKSAGRYPTLDERKYLIQQVRFLLRQDAQDFADLKLPLSLLQPESASEHFNRWIKILFDSSKSFWRRRNQKTQEFSKEIKSELNNFPKYYQRNFHHQTNGYLSDESADLYEHQVELLFRGTADPMRRRLLRPMIQKLKKRKKLRILEIGCGAGTFTYYLSQCFPQAEITGVDLSPNYIRHATKRFVDSKNINFMVGDGENLGFKDDWFDGVVSVFLHHELPQKVRENVISESLRVCSPNGFWGLSDSLQLDDDPNLNWAISEFPKTFHEPYFTNYIKKPMGAFLAKNFSNLEFKEENYLLTKILYRS